MEAARAGDTRWKKPEQQSRALPRLSFWRIHQWSVERNKSKGTAVICGKVVY